MPIYQAVGLTERRLVAAPESGIGFQVLRYQGQFLVALNATILVPLSDLRYGEVTADQLALFLSGPQDTLRPGFETIDMQDEFQLVFSQLDPQLYDSDTGLTAPEIVAAPSESAISPRRPYSYYRFSAASQDKRVTASGDFLPGTYATTYADFSFVPSGFAAVGRYALPNPVSARFVFQITTYDRPTKMGTATPNFGQAGGGVEVLFGDGATNRPGASFMIEAG